MAKRKAAKGKARKAARGGNRSREALIVASKVRNYIRQKNMRVAGDALEALSSRVYELIDEAISRCKGNKRQTIRDCDF